ncbi:MAG: M1 family aminopeptidase [Bacteroidota bacterium]
MWKFIKHEWKYWLSTPMLWIFFGINTLLVLGAVSSDNINIGGGVGSVLKNSPFVIQNYYGVMSLICLLMTTAFMNATANRDFQSGMYQFVFSSPIKQWHYFFGKFFGAILISIIPLLGVSMGALLGPLMPWADPARSGPVYLSGHVNGILCYAIPNTIVAGVIIFSLAILFRNAIVSFVGAVGILVLYGIASGFIRDVEKEWLSAILDPFGFRPAGIISKYFTVDEKNVSAIPLTGWLLLNRVFWIGVSMLILAAAYFRFSFSKRKEKSDSKNTKKSEKENIIVSEVQWNPKAKTTRFSVKSFAHNILFETKSILIHPTFIIITIIGLINLIVNLTSFTSNYGTDQYPVTYDVIDSIRGSFYIFLIAIITFYSGVLVWKERDSGISDIVDATPVKSSLLFSSKLIALSLSLFFVLASTIILGCLAQILYGYTRFQLDVYFKSLLVMDFLSFIYLSVVALFFHYLINNRYIAYFAFVTFIILNSFLWSVFEINSNMVKFGGTPNVTYSDMNGFGPFVPSAFWFNIYWILASVIICIVLYGFYVRGRELQFKSRLNSAFSVIKKNKIVLGTFLILFMLCGSFIFYNTKILNKYISSDETENRQMQYEKLYKKYENLTQPKIFRVKYNIDLLPDERNMVAKSELWVKNKSKEKISELHFTMPLSIDSVTIDIKNAALKLRDNKLNYRIYSLKKTLMPGDSLQVNVTSVYINKGFENEVSFTSITQNGTFFNETDFVPLMGYVSGYEISDKNKRNKLGLPKKKRSVPLNESDTLARMKSYVVQDADWVEVETIMSTTEDQIAVAPGSLLKSWKQNGKSYFHYKLDKASLNFYSFISARYEVARKKFKGIDIEVYYSKEHAYNVPNMLLSVEKSLDYYTSNFGPYYHKQARIIEFPRYASFAQAFPGTMPYSEGIGFITDLREVKADDIDLVFYVVAHEMGHQYWAHQLCGASMQGSEWMSEGFAQYSALMVMEKEYGKDKMKKFLKYEMNGYLTGRSSEFEAERPIYKTEGQAYIHYQKASVAMYYLKEMIGEQNVNKALQTLINDYALKEPPYATSMNALRAFKKVTPDSLQYLISDLFENITLFSNRIEAANYKKINNEYEVTLNVITEKYLADSLGKEKSIPVNDYMDVLIFGEKKSKSDAENILFKKRIKIQGRENKFTFKVKELPLKAGIDPNHYLVDRIPDDNIKSVVN